MYIPTRSWVLVYDTTPPSGLTPTKIFCHLHSTCNILMLWICFKPVMWYTEMYHVRPFFFSVVSWYFVFHGDHSQHVYPQEGSLLCFLSTIELSAWLLFISWRYSCKTWVRQIWHLFLDTSDTIKRAVSFPFEGKHIVIEHHVI